MPAEPAAPPSEYMTSGEVGREFGVDAGTVARWADDGRLPHFKTLGGQRRFRREDVERLKDQEQVA